MNESNPLSQHYRQPALYIKLPSEGKYWKEGAISLPVSGELPVFPMTTKDEIALKTPDALLNGEGVVATIQSCCPNITDAWSMPAIDVDYVLIAIRIASYGHELSFESTCPNCKEVSPYIQDLRMILSDIVSPDFKRGLTIDGLVFKFKPQQYVQTNAANQAEFEEQRLIQLISDPDLDEEVKKVKLRENLTKMLEINLRSLSFSTENITITNPVEIVVDNTDQIFEYYMNAETKIIKAVKVHLDSLAESIAIKPFKLKCDKCEHEYESKFEFDYTNFFA